jgi:hypothetical protein
MVTTVRVVASGCLEQIGHCQDWRFGRTTDARKSLDSVHVDDQTVLNRSIDRIAAA